jgi:hypothetical protein
MESLRIVMNWSAQGSCDGYVTRQFKKGIVYDTRIPADCVAADGICHSITHTLAAHFLNTGMAHLDTNEEYWARIDARRRAKLTDPNTPESTKALMRQQDVLAGIADSILRILPSLRAEGDGYEQ